MRAALPLKATSARADRAEERARANALRTKIDELNAALAEERQRVDRLNKQVEALSAEVVRAEKQAEAVVGRAERAEAGRDAERARADALADRMHLLQAELVAAETAAGQARTDAQAAERAHAEASVSLLALSEQLDAYEVEAAAHRGRGLLARLWDVLRGGIEPTADDLRRALRRVARRPGSRRQPGRCWEVDDTSGHRIRPLMLWDHTGEGAPEKLAYRPFRAISTIVHATRPIATVASTRSHQVCSRSGGSRTRVCRCTSVAGGSSGSSDWPMSFSAAA